MAQATTDESSGPGEWSDHFDQSIRAESVRAKVVLSACYLDELVRQMIALMLKPPTGEGDSLLDVQGPLGTFSARIDLALRMGLFSSDTKTSLHLVRKIRNKFAHSLGVADFGDHQVQGWNATLHSLNDNATQERRAHFSPGPVGDFEKSVSWLVFWLRNVIEHVPTTCPHCGSEMEHRARIRDSRPGGAHPIAPTV